MRLTCCNAVARAGVWLDKCGLNGKRGGHETVKSVKSSAARRKSTLAAKRAPMPVCHFGRTRNGRTSEHASGRRGQPSRSNFQGSTPSPFAIRAIVERIIEDHNFNFKIARGSDARSQKSSNSLGSPIHARVCSADKREVQVWRQRWPSLEALIQWFPRYRSRAPNGSDEPTSFKIKGPP